MLILGFESSCDETGVAVYDTAVGGAAGLRAHAVYSQIALHAEYGGVVPELASRDHVRKLLPLVRQTLAEAGLIETVMLRMTAHEFRRIDRHGAVQENGNGAETASRFELPDVVKQFLGPPYGKGGDDKRAAAFDCSFRHRSERFGWIFI